MGVNAEFELLGMAVKNQKQLNDLTIKDNIPDMVFNSVHPRTLSNILMRRLENILG